MNQFNRLMGFAALSCLLSPAAAMADSWTCVHSNIVREVKIEYPGAAPVPCSVVYNKPDEGASSQVLWSAENQEGYCEEQAQGFVAKLESLGWACVNDAAVTDGISDSNEAVETSEPGDPNDPSDPGDPGVPMNDMAPGGEE